MLLMLLIAGPEWRAHPGSPEPQRQGSGRASRDASAMRRSAISIESLMTLDEVAAYLRVPKETVYHWRKHGEGPRGFRTGRYVRFRRSDVDAWLETQRDPEPFRPPMFPAGL